MVSKQKNINEMKVGFLSYEYPPMIYGGVGIHVRELTKHLANNIDQVHVFTSYIKELNRHDQGTVHVHISPKPLMPTSNRLGNLFGKVMSNFNTGDTLNGYISNDKRNILHPNSELSSVTASGMMKETNTMPPMIEDSEISRLDLDMQSDVIMHGMGAEMNSSIAVSESIQGKRDRSFLINGSNCQRSDGAYLHRSSELLAPTSNYSKSDLERIMTNINVAKMVNEYNLSDKLELLHSHGGLIQMAATEVKKTTQLPLVMTAHSVEINRVRPDRLSTLMEQNVVNNVDRFIAVSESIKKELNQTFGVDYNKITVIPNGVDAAVFKRQNTDDICMKYQLDSKFVVLFVGRDDPQKGAKRLIDAVKNLAGQIPSIMLVMVGQKDIYFDKHILCLPRVSRSELVKLYSLSDVFVLPSIYEPFGIVLLEAMACETACVGMRVGGMPDIINHNKTGVLVESHDPTGISDAIFDLYNDPEKRYRMGKNGRDRVISNFDWGVISEKTIEVYRQVLH